MEKENKLFLEEKKNRERKGGKYLEKEYIFFCGGEGKRRRKRRKIFGYGFFSGGEEKLQRKMRKVFEEGKYLVHRG